MKKYLLGVIALVTAITLNSFTLKTHTTRGPVLNWIYMDYPNDAFKDDPSHYQLYGTDGTATLPCPGGTHRCGVQAQDDGSGQPDFTISYIKKTKN